jgi:CheY-like chemotaxis protein
LIIDDNAEVRSLLGFALLRDGWITDTAADGAAAVARLEQELPDLILLDLNMPDTDGWEVLARCAATLAWSGIPVVVMSADHRQGRIVLELGAAAFLPKPFSLDDLREVLRQLLPTSP